MPKDFQEFPNVVFLQPLNAAHKLRNKPTILVTLGNLTIDYMKKQKHLSSL